MSTTFRHRRGDTFERTFTLSDSWLGSHFDEVWFTVRKEPGKTTQTNDAGALGQATKTGGGIVFDGNEGTITIVASVTNAWEPGSACWDCQGKITGTPDKIYTFDSGKFEILPDVTRST